MWERHPSTTDAAPCNMCSEWFGNLPEPPQILHLGLALGGQGGAQEVKWIGGDSCNCASKGAADKAD